MTKVEALTQRATRSEPSTTTAPPTASQKRGEPRMERTPLQRLQDALMRKFGHDIPRTTAANAEAPRGTRDAQRLDERSMVWQGESVEQRRRRLGKSHMTEEKT